MESKKWPVLAQVFIGFGCISGIFGIIGGLGYKSIIDIIFGIAVLVMFWNVYKFKRWARIGLTILLSLRIILILVSMSAGMPIIVGLSTILINCAMIYYFNSKSIIGLFA